MSRLWRTLAMWSWSRQYRRWLRLADALCDDESEKAEMLFSEGMAAAEKAAFAKGTPVNVAVVHSPDSVVNPHRHYVVLLQNVVEGEEE